MEEHRSTMGDSLGSVGDVPADELRRMLPAMAEDLERAGAKLTENIGAPGSRDIEVELIRDNGQTYTETFQGHTLRHAANAAEISTGHKAVSVMLLDVARPLRVKVMGRCAACGDLVLVTEHWQQTDAGGLRCEDHRL